MSKTLSDTLYAMAPRAQVFEYKFFLPQDQSLMWASLINSGDELLARLLEKGRTEHKVLVNGSMLPVNMLISKVTSTTIALHRPRSWRYRDQTRRPPLATYDLLGTYAAPDIA